MASETKQAETTRMVAAPLGADSVNGRVTQVGSALTDQPGLIDALHKNISELEARLLGVLREDNDVAEKALSEPRGPLVPLADQLDNHNGQLRWARDRLASMLERLEV